MTNRHTLLPRFAACARSVFARCSAFTLVFTAAIVVLVTAAGVTAGRSSGSSAAAAAFARPVSTGAAAGPAAVGSGHGGTAEHGRTARRRRPPRIRRPGGGHGASRPEPLVKTGRPYPVYDSVLPGDLPGHQVSAVYANGRYAASPAEMKRHAPVLWIDTTGNDPRASVLDVEPGDATPAQAASWAYHKLRAQPDAIARIYTMRSEWDAARAAIGTLPSSMRSHVRWWIADPTGVPHLLPGSDATQWYWGPTYDRSTATPRF